LSFEESGFSDLRVPTTTFTAEIALVEGETLIGRFFVPAHTSLHPGPMRPDERLNDEADFFPFLPADSTEPVIVNKRQVAWVAFDVRTFPSFRDEESYEPPSMPEHRVGVHCRGRTLAGTLVIDLPQYKSRVLDRLNHQERFLRIKEEHFLYYVNRDHISKVRRVGSARRRIGSRGRTVAGANRRNRRGFSDVCRTNGSRPRQGRMEP
jgi:hypothetical protein